MGGICSSPSSTSIRELPTAEPPNNNSSSNGPTNSFYFQLNHSHQNTPHQSPNPSSALLENSNVAAGMVPAAIVEPFHSSPPSLSTSLQLRLNPSTQQQRAANQRHPPPHHHPHHPHLPHDDSEAAMGGGDGAVAAAAQEEEEAVAAALAAVAAYQQQHPSSISSSGHSNSVSLPHPLRSSWRSNPTLVQLSSLAISIPFYELEDLSSYLPSTPKGAADKSIYKFMCPICFFYYKKVFKIVSCCQNYICNSCALSHLRVKLNESLDEWVAVPASEPSGGTSAERGGGIDSTATLPVTCPACNTDGIRFQKVRGDDKPRSYVESPSTRDLLEKVRRRNQINMANRASFSKIELNSSALSPTSSTAGTQPRTAVITALSGPVLLARATSDHTSYHHHHPQHHNDHSISKDDGELSSHDKLGGGNRGGRLNEFASVEENADENDEESRNAAAVERMRRRTHSDPSVQARSSTSQNSSPNNPHHNTNSINAATITTTTTSTYQMSSSPSISSSPFNSPFPSLDLFSTTNTQLLQQQQYGGLGRVMETDREKEEKSVVSRADRNGGNAAGAERSVIGVASRIGGSSSSSHHGGSGDDGLDEMKVASTNELSSSSSFSFFPSFHPVLSSSNNPSFFDPSSSSSSSSASSSSSSASSSSLLPLQTNLPLSHFDVSYDDSIASVGQVEASMRMGSQTSSSVIIASSPTAKGIHSGELVTSVPGQLEATSTTGIMITPATPTNVKIVQPMSANFNSRTAPIPESSCFTPGSSSFAATLATASSPVPPLPISSLVDRYLSGTVPFNQNIDDSSTAKSSTIASSSRGWIVDGDGSSTAPSMEPSPAIQSVPESNAVAIPEVNLA